MVCFWRERVKLHSEPKKALMLLTRRLNSAGNKLPCNHSDGSMLSAKHHLTMFRILEPKVSSNTIHQMVRQVSKRDLGNTATSSVATVKIWVSIAMTPKKSWSNLSWTMVCQIEAIEKTSSTKSLTWLDASQVITKTSTPCLASITPVLSFQAGNQIQSRNKWTHSSKKTLSSTCPMKLEAGNKTQKYRFKVT